jgi:hypothetical protein
MSEIRWIFKSILVTFLAFFLTPTESLPKWASMFIHVALSATFSEMRELFRG